MDSRQIETGHGPTISVVCRGDLKVQGWAEPSVLIKGQATEVNEGEKALKITGTQDLHLMIPSASILTITEVNGDLAIKGLAGETEISAAFGDVYLSSVGAATAGSIHGDLSISSMNGSFSAQEVMGDASIRNVLDVNIEKVNGDCAVRNANGDISISIVMGDLSLRTVNGNIEVEEVYRDTILRNLGGENRVAKTSGDIRLRGGLPKGKHQFNADGDIVVRWPADAPIDIQAAAPSISWRLQLEGVQEEEGRLTGHLGDGEVYLILTAKGRIILKGLDSGSEPWEEYSGVEYDIGADISNLGVLISGEINNKLTELSQRMEQQFGPEFAARMEQKAQQAARKAELAAEKAMRKAEKAAKKAQWQMNRRYPPPEPPKTDKPSSPPAASEEEQLKILKMVEQGTISPEEASDLLAALDGR